MTDYNAPAVVNQSTIRITGDMLDDTPGFQQVRGQLQALPGDSTILAENVLSWSAPQQVFLVELKKQLPRLLLTLQGDTRGDGDWVKVVLAAIPNRNEPAKVAAARDLAMILVLNLHFDARDIFVGHIAEAFKNAGIDSVNRRSLAKSLSSADSRAAAANDSGTPQRLALDMLNSLGKDLDGNTLLLRKGSGFAFYKGDGWQSLGESAFRELIAKRLGSETSQSIRRFLVDDVILHMRANAVSIGLDVMKPCTIGQDGEIVPSEERLVPVANGMLNITDVENGRRPTLDPVSPRIYCPWRLATRYEAGAECPAWRHCLNQVLPRLSEDDQRQRIFQQFAGYLLLVDDHQFEKMLLPYGTGSNGKSTLIETLVALLGDENVSYVAIQNLDGGFLSGEIVGKLLNVTTESSTVRRAESANLKTVVSGERLQVNRKYEQPVTIKPSARLIFAGNPTPLLADTSWGMFRRLQFLPFDVQFGGPGGIPVDRQIGERLKRELPGILNWAIDGLTDLLRLGDFAQCRVCNEALESVRRESDTVRSWFDEQCTVESGAFVATQEAYRRYLGYCAAEGRTAFPMNLFVERLLPLGIVRLRPRSGHDQRRGLLNLRLRYW